MGWSDDIRGAADVFGRAASEAFRERVGRVDAWSQAREDSRRVDDFDDKMNKAANAAKAAGLDGNHEPSRDPKALSFDPFDLVSQMGWREKPSPLTYRALESIGATVPVLADVIRARSTQVQTFCQRPEDRHSPGFRVRPIDKTQAVTGDVQKRCYELEQTVLDCGFRNDRASNEITSFREFAGMFIADSLTFDQACFEIVPDRKGRPSCFSIVDPTTIRLMDTYDRQSDKPFAIQMIDHSIVTDFTPQELAFCIRNPRSGIDSYGYGRSEIETLVREVTGFLWGIDYNRRFFSNGSSTKGILNFKGTIPDRHLQAFRRQWYSMVQGVENAWRTPITNADEIQWINMQLSNKDMEFSSWIDFLIKIVCARYQIAPEEVNFSYGNSGQSQAMGTAPIEEKLKASKDLGLRPLVYFFFDMINSHWLQRIDPAYELVPVGLDSKGVDAETDLLQKQTKIYLTVDEAREAVGLEALDGGMGGVILDPTWLQFFQNQQAQEEDEGMDDESADEGDEDESADEDAGGDDNPPEAPDPIDDFSFSDSESGDPIDVVDDDETGAGPAGSAGEDTEKSDNSFRSLAKGVPGGLDSHRTFPPQGEGVRYEIDL